MRPARFFVRCEIAKPRKEPFSLLDVVSLLVLL
jgi:hypothetical protein